MKRQLWIIALSAVIGCATTNIIDTWKEPSFQGPFAFKRIAIVAIGTEESTRRIIEDQLVEKIGPTRAVASHTFLTTPQLKDKDAAKAAIRGNGADGVVTVRLIEKTQQNTYVRGSYTPASYPLYGYAPYAWGTAVAPSVVTTDTLVRIETNIYSVNDEKLLWSAMSQTFNPDNVKNTINEVAAAVRKELVKQKLLAEK